MFHRKSLTFHLAKHEAEEGPSLTCKICEKDFADRKELIDHLSSHSRWKPHPKDKTHSCSKCDKSFPSAKELKRHMVTHTKER